jgi:outer membrane murein-binding lipoprotein Lpp/uncharacterized Fe-S cluster protein YjdI
MKTLRNIALLAIVGSVLMFAGCEEEESTKTIEKEEAEQVLSNNSEEMASDLDQMANSQGMEAMNVLVGLTEKDDPFAQKKSLGGESVVSTLQEALRTTENKIARRKSSQPFPFDDLTGTYEWQAQGEWNVDLNTPSDAIVIEFPTDTTVENPENNATMTLSSYSETMITDSSGNEQYVPTDIEATLKVNDTKVAEINWELSIEQVNNETPVLNSLDASIYLKPFSYSLELTQNSLLATMSTENVKDILGVDIDVTFMDNMEDVKKVQGSVKIRNLQFKGWIKPYAMENVDAEGITSTGDLVDYYNEQIDVSVFRADNGNKLADIKFVEDTDSQNEMPMNLVFVFKNGDTAPVKGYFQNVMEKIQQHLNRYNIS